MSALIRKGKTKSLLDEDSFISEVITEAFDNVELTNIGKLCLDARVNNGLTQEQASALLKVKQRKFCEKNRRFVVTTYRVRENI